MARRGKLSRRVDSDCRQNPNSRSIARRHGPAGFDFTSHMRALCGDMMWRLPQLQHIKPDQVAISFSQARKRVHHGIFATTTPMRFEDGALTGLRRGRKFAVQRLFDQQGVEMLYIVSFYLPRFMDIGFWEKLITIVHELWHISPDFNGDLRRHPGRCYAHTHSQKEYDAEMRAIVDQWLASSPPANLYEFLHSNYDQLNREHGGVFGIKIPHPKLIPSQ